MAGISFRNVSKIYPDGTHAVRSLSLDVASGEFMVFVGPSGCGKTTALRMVAGLEDVSEGDVAIDDRVVNDVASKDRDIAMVFQSYALYPHMSVFENMAFGLKLRKVPREEMKQRVERAAALLGLSDYLERKPRALSGGQRQRVAMGRAIVREPKAFLMDEPLSNLDAKLRVQMRAEIASLQRDLGVTTIYVTHDQTEAMTMGDRVAVIRKGELQQVAPPQELYDRPANLFVGGFIGSPAMNMLAASADRSNGTATVRIGATSVPVDGGLGAALGSRSGDVIVGIRPEDLSDGADAGSGSPTIPGIVRRREPLGAEVIVHIEIEARPAVTEEVRELAADSGTDVLQPDPERQTTTTLIARFDPRTHVQDGDRIDVAVDTAALHIFDPSTGTAIRAVERGGNG